VKVKVCGEMAALKYGALWIRFLIEIIQSGVALRLPPHSKGLSRTHNRHRWTPRQRAWREGAYYQNEFFIAPYQQGRSFG